MGGSFVPGEGRVRRRPVRNDRAAPNGPQRISTRVTLLSTPVITKYGALSTP